MDEKKLPYNKMDMNPNVDWDAVLKMLQGTCNEQEKLHFEQWLAQSAGNRKFFEELKLSWETSGKIFDDYNPDPEKSWKVITQKTGLKSVTKSLYWYLSAAATILIALGVALWLLVPENSKQILVENKTDSAFKYVLPDSSVLWMDKGTNIQYNQDFKNRRFLQLRGKSYFEVTHNQQKPFTIKCKDAQVQVLGTNFLIDNKADTSKVIVEVYTGKVLFVCNQQRDTLLKGEAAVANLKNMVIKRLNNVDINSLAWKTGRIIFENASLKEVCEFLESYYHTKVTIENEQIASKALTSLLDHLSIEESLTIIAETLQVHFRKTNEGYVFY